MTDFPSVGATIEFVSYPGGRETWTRAVVIDDPRNDAQRVAIQPEGRTEAGKPLSIKLRLRRKIRLISRL